MTNITVAVPDELAEAARIQGLLDPQYLTPLVCEMLVRVTTYNNAANQEALSSRLLFEDLLPLAGSAGPGLPEDFATNHDHYIHGAHK